MRQFRHLIQDRKAARRLSSNRKYLSPDALCSEWDMALSHWDIWSGPFEGRCAFTSVGPTTYEGSTFIPNVEMLETQRRIPQGGTPHLHWNSTKASGFLSLNFCHPLLGAC
jgi:hypothetical protein